jgi:protein-S-isoprenylcysteine O-methyltransferase Ste14
VVFRLITQTVLWLAVTAALLFIPASTVHWPSAWIMLGETGAVVLAVGYWLLTHDTPLLKERLSSVIQSEQKAWDKLLMSTILILWSGWFVLMGLDVGRHGLSQIPIWLQILGAVGIPLCAAVCHLTFKENSYAAPVVKIQEARGQTTITTGPYALVRHPMYAGAIPYFIGTALLLGSPWGLVLAPLIIVLLGLRAVLEERALHTALADYEDYARQVRYRLIPFVW